MYLVPMIHSGETVSVATEYGANEFLKQCTNPADFKFFSSDLKQVDAIRTKGRKKKKLNAADRNHLRYVYTKFQAIAEWCDADLFRERVPDREIVAWLTHASSIFQEIAKGQHWITTGILLRHDEQLFASLPFLFKHAVPVVSVFEDNNAFFESIVALMLARKGKDLDPGFAQTIEFVVGNIFNCSMTRFDNPWVPEKALKKLDATGILEHYLLCAAIKEPLETTETPKDLPLKYLLSSTAFTKKRFKVGTPCGDTLRAILDGDMKVCPRARPYLQSLLKLSSSMEDENTYYRSRDFCRHCIKTDFKFNLLFCSRCNQTCYCSKECQKADWANHKPLCCPKTKKVTKNADASEQLIVDYAERHYVPIMLRLMNECDKNPGLTIHDFVLELDFNPDENGNVPVLQDCPQFKLFTNSKYVEIVAAQGYSASEVESMAAHIKNRTICELFCFNLFAHGAKTCCIFSW